MKKITQLFAFLLITILGHAQPTTNAPAPTRASGDVFAIYNSSNTYSSTYSNLNPNWGQSGFSNNDTAFTNGGTISPVIRYSNFNYQGLEISIPGVNVSTMEYIHLDIWSSNLSAVRLVPIQPGVGEVGQNMNITSFGNWISIDIPLSTYTGYSFGEIIQLKFDNPIPSAGLEFYVDNIYFWKNPIVPGSVATLSDLKVDGTTVAGFGSGVENYTVQVQNGNPTVPQITAATTTDPTATRVITQATSVPGSATVVVTSQNTLVTKTYTVNYVFTGPSTNAPTPPNRPVADVISLFSDSYTNINISEWSTPWDDSSQEDLVLSGNTYKKITFLNFLGVQLANYVDASQMTHFHMDYYIDADVNLIGRVLNPKLSNHGAQSGETSALLLTNLPTTAGSWVSLDVPLTAFGGAPNRENFYQFLLTSNIGTVYVDNIYLHKNTVLSSDNFNVTKVKLYPNPTSNILNIEANGDVQNIAVYNVLGQEVMNRQTSGTSIGLDVSSLNAGIYVIKTMIDGNVSSTKFIKE